MWHRTRRASADVIILIMLWYAVQIPKSWRSLLYSCSRLRWSRSEFWSDSLSWMRLTRWFLWRKNPYVFGKGAKSKVIRIVDLSGLIDLTGLIVLWLSWPNRPDYVLWLSWPNRPDDVLWLSWPNRPDYVLWLSWPSRPDYMLWLSWPNRPDYVLWLVGLTGLILYINYALWLSWPNRPGYVLWLSWHNRPDYRYVLWLSWPNQPDCVLWLSLPIGMIMSVRTKEQSNADVLWEPFPRVRVIKQFVRRWIIISVISCRQKALVTLWTSKSEIIWRNKMPTFFQALDKTKRDKWFSSPSHF